MDDLVTYSRARREVVFGQSQDTDTVLEDVKNIDIYHDDRKVNGDVVPFFSASINHFSPLRPSQLDLSSTDSILLDFCESIVPGKHNQLISNRCQPNVLNLFTVRRW